MIAATERAPRLESWQLAWRRAMDVEHEPITESFHDFGGHAVHLRVVGRSLAHHVGRTFAHLRRDAPCTPVLRIDLWDESATGVPCPPAPPVAARALTTRIGSGLATICAGGRVIRYEHARSVTCLDRADGVMIGWRASAASLPVEQRSKPIPLLLRIWYYDRNIDVIHAGLVAQGDRGVLVGGATGTGKSTTVLTCVAGGFDYLGDDEVGLERENDAYVGHSLYGSARLHHGPFSPALSAAATPPAVDVPPDEKPLLFVSELAPARMRARVRIRAVALPSITTNPRTRVRRVSAGEGLLRLGATSLFSALGLGERVFDRLQRLVDVVPCYVLELGRDASTVQCIEQILAETTA